MKQIINKLGFLFLFLDNLYLPINLGFDFRLNYILYLGFITYYLISFRKVKIFIRPFLYLFFLCILLFFVPLIKGGYVFGFIKQSILIGYQLLFCYLLINSYNFDIQKIFKDYLSITYLICIIAFIQLFFIKIGLSNLADFSFLGFDLGNFYSSDRRRIQAWFEEPSFLAYSIMPAVFAALAQIFGISGMMSKRLCFMVLCVLLLSKSSVGYLGVLIGLSIIIFSKYPILKRPIYLTSIIVSIPVVGFFVYKIPDVQKRVDDTYYLFMAYDLSKEDINRTNLSTYALYSNYRVTKEVLKNDLVFGTGVGTYEKNYDQYINTVIPETPLRDMYQLNKKDANSLFLRILAEIGLIGLLFFIVFILHNRIRFDSIQFSPSFLWVFNNGILVLIILRLLRQGHYTSLGFVMFLVLFYFSKKEIKINERIKKVV